MEHGPVAEGGKIISGTIVQKDEDGRKRTQRTQSQKKKNKKINGMRHEFH